MATTPSPYEVLGVPVRATAAEVQEAFKSALRTRRHSPQVVRHAYEELRVPQKRLRHDLLHPEPVDLCGLLAPVVERVGPVTVDDASAPLPPWQALVDAGLDPAAVDRPLPAAERLQHDGVAAGPVPRDVVPPFEFPELP